MNLVTITIEVNPISEDKTRLHAHIAHRKGERTWRGTYQGSYHRASLGGIWLALKELDDARLYKCVVNLKVNQATQRIINDFNWQNPVPELLDAYEHLRPLLRKHTILPEKEKTGIQVDSLIGEIKHFWGHRHLRTRLPRAAQLVAMGGVEQVSEHQWEVFSQTIPGGQPYSVTTLIRQGRHAPFWLLKEPKRGWWQCNCLDNNPACKHILAVAMQSKLTKGE